VRASGVSGDSGSGVGAVSREVSVSRTSTASRTSKEGSGEASGTSSEDSKEDSEENIEEDSGSGKEGSEEASGICETSGAGHVYTPQPSGRPPRQSPAYLPGFRVLGLGVWS